MSEIWREVENFPGYAVSSFGRVKLKTRQNIQKYLKNSKTVKVSKNLF